MWTLSAERYAYLEEKTNKKVQMTGSEGTPKASDLKSKKHATPNILPFEVYERNLYCKQSDYYRDQ